MNCKTDTAQPTGYCVDASCIGNWGSKDSDGYFHGRTEWRCMDLETGEVVFNSDVYQQSTVNIGEFCAIVDAMRMISEGTIPIGTIWSDSKIAINWVNKRTTRTKLPFNERTKDAIIHMGKCLDWLSRQEELPELRWWNKYSMGGENPADFGRK